MNGMKQSLESLIVEIEARGGKMRSGASEETVLLAERVLDVAIPAPLREFLLRNDGMDVPMDPLDRMIWPVRRLQLASQGEDCLRFLEIEGAILVNLSDILLFADELTELPVYGVCLANDETYGRVVNLNDQMVVSKDLEGFLVEFVKGQDFELV